LRPFLLKKDTMSTRCLSGLARYVAALIASIVAASSVALAQTVPTTTVSTTPPAMISGTVRSASGALIAGASVQISGPMTAQATTDAKGGFAISVPPGIYSITVRKGGFNSATLADLTVAPGTSAPLNVSLAPVDLSSLQTIGSATSTSRTGRSAINTSASSADHLTAQQFSDQAAPQVNDVLQRLPDVTLQHMGDDPDTSIVVGGAQPYETQVLIDGHPLALGQYGVWTSQYFPSYLVGGVETQSGPGNTTPFANIAVGGTVNFLTPSYTAKPTAELTYGEDTFKSQYTNLLATGSVGNLAYVVALGAGGLNGPYFQSQHCDVSSSAPNLPGNDGIVEFCGDASGSLLTRGSVIKLRYNFTPTTSFEAGFVGAWGTFSPQGAAWGTSDGATTILDCYPGTLQCTNPADTNLVGKTINGYTWYPGTFVYNNQTLFDGQFRTSFGNNTLLIRPYLGVIEPEIIDGLDEGEFPQFFGPNASYPACTSLSPTTTCYPGPQSLPPGTQIPSTGLTNPNAFENSACPPGNIYSYSQLNSPQNTIVSVNGQEECFQYPYTTFEQDKLYGSTFTILHPMGDSTLNFTYDFHGQSTFAYINAPANVTVPFSTDRYSTFSLTGDIHIAPKLSLDAGLYNTTWAVNGVQPLYVDGVPQVDQYGDAILTGLDRHISHFDPHLSFVVRPNADTSVRVAWGTSATFPFVGQVSGTASYEPYATSAPIYTDGILVAKNPSLDPEVSTAYNLGADHRFANGSVFSGDLTDTVIHNVFQSVIVGEVVPANPSCFQAPCILGVSTPINAARLHTEMATIRYHYEPRFGLGYNLSAAATRSIVDGIPNSAYNTSAAFPANGVQICGNGLTTGTSTCIPYLKGYGQLTYTWHKGSYVALGVDYEGVNNSYFQPPFAQVDMTYRTPVSKYAEFQVSAENLLNTNNFQNLPAPNAGVNSVAATNTGLTSYTQTLVPTAPRTIRAQVRFHVGR
jgi:hypothetical protein